MRMKSAGADNDYLFVVKRLISILDAPIQFDPYLILHHPSYPGFLSIKDALTSMGFSVEAYHISDFSPADIVTPSIIHIHRPEAGNELVIVRKITNRKIVIETFSEGIISFTPSDFTKIWDGNVMSISYGDRNGKSPDYFEYNSSKLIKLASFGLLLLAIPLVIISLFKIRVSPDWRFLITAIFGCCVSIFLLIKQFKLKPTSFLDRFCETDKISCREVLNSDKSRIVLGITWAEIGFTYFAGTLFTMTCCLIIGRVNFFNVVLSWLSLLTIPVILYTVYLQMKILKKWCLFCLFIHALLVANIIISIGHLSDQVDVSEFLSLPFYFSGFLVVAIGGLLLKKILVLNSTILSYKERIALFKSNFGYFDYLLKTNRLYQYKSIDTDMQWGQSDSKLIVVAILTLDCRYCFTVGRELNQLKEMFKDNLLLKVAFVAKATDSLDPLLIEILLKSRDQDELFDSWLKTEYDIPTPSVPLENHLQRDSILSDLQKRRRWLVDNKINMTPQVIINDSLVGQGLTPMDFLYYFRKIINYENEKTKLVDVNSTDVHFSVS